MFIAIRSPENYNHRKEASSLRLGRIQNRYYFHFLCNEPELASILHVSAFRIVSINVLIYFSDASFDQKW